MGRFCFASWEFMGIGLATRRIFPKKAARFDLFRSGHPRFATYLPLITQNMGNRGIFLCCVCSTTFGVSAVFFLLSVVSAGLKLTLYVVFQTPSEQHVPNLSHKKLLRPTNSQAIPNYKMRTGHKRHQDLQTLPSQVSYRHPLHPKKEIRREREQTSPQVARAAGHPETGQAADWAVAAAQSAVSISAPATDRGRKTGQ